MEQKTMPAVVYQSVGHFALEERPQPVLQEDTDAIIRVTLAAICTSDLHIKHGNVTKAVPGTIVGHERETEGFILAREFPHASYGIE